MSDIILHEMSEDGKEWKTLVVVPASAPEKKIDKPTPSGIDADGTILYDIPDGFVAYEWKINGQVMPEKNTAFRPEWLELLKDKNVDDDKS